MMNDLDKAIESSRAELQSMTRKVVDLQKAINQLLMVKGLPPEYSDVASGDGVVIGSEPKARQFLGMNMIDAAKECLKMANRAATAAEILAGLEKGDFEFPKEWKAKLRLRNLAISIGSNKDFVVFKTRDGKAYGLAEKHPDKVREREKNKNGEESESKKMAMPENVADKSKG